MNATLKIIWLLLSFVLIQSGFSQNQTDIRINEVMTLNSNGPIDNFGHHAPWIEIFNSSYGTVNIAGMYLTNDVSQPKKYRIPSDGRMTLSPQSYLLFYFDGNSEHGVLHANFRLDSIGTIILFASNGRTVIDSVTFNFVEVDQVLARTTDGNGAWAISKSYTPNQTNIIKEGVKNADLFVQYDPIGIGMAIISMTVVMCALSLLYLLYKQLAKLFKSDFNVSLKPKKSRNTDGEEVFSERSDIELSGEINAAIALAIHLYRSQLHDTEDAVITLKKVTKTYSPWSSKLYMLRQIPNKTMQPQNKRK